MSKKDLIGEIMYEEGSQIPFIQIEKDEEMPKRLFIYGYFMTGEFEPGPAGEDVPICDMDIFQFFSYNYAKEVLDPETLDKVRTAFGLETLAEAKEKGKELTTNVIENAEDSDKKKVH